MRFRPIYLIAASVFIGAANDGHAGQFDCLIEPRQTIEIRPSTEGLITRINVQRGDVVHAGQILVELDSGLERASAEAAKFRSEMLGAVKSRESRVDFLAQKSSRREKLVKENFISVQDRDESAAEHRLAKAELLDAGDNRKVARLDYQRTMEQLRLRTIRSPIDGIVVDRLINPGELADNRDLRKPLLKLAEINVLHVEVSLPTAAYQAIKPGQSVAVIPEQPAGSRYIATVKVIDRVFDAASGTFGVRLELANPSALIPAGVKCKAVFDGVAEVVRQRMKNPGT